VSNGRSRERGEEEDERTSEVVLNVLVERELSDLPERKLLVRPDLGQIENGVSEVLCLLLSHDLNRDGPGEKEIEASEDDQRRKEEKGRGVESTRRRSTHHEGLSPRAIASVRSCPEESGLVPSIFAASGPV